MSDIALNSTNEPWWAKHRDKAFLLAFVTLFFMMVGLLPSPTSRSIDLLADDHKEMGQTLKVMCVHGAVTTKEAMECVAGKVETLEKGK